MSIILFFFVFEAWGEMSMFVHNFLHGLCKLQGSVTLLTPTLLLMLGVSHLPLADKRNSHIQCCLLSKTFY